MPRPETSVPSSDSSWRRDLLLLALVFGVFFGFRLGSYPLANPDEGRNAEIPREMIANHDWVTPRLDGVDYFEKPPLVYWAVGAMEEIFGDNEWAVRTVPAVFALGGVLLAYAAARRLYGRNAGLASAAVLGTALLYAGLARFLILDMAVSVLMSATLFCFILAVQEPPGTRRRLLFYGLYASSALATLTKGLMGFLVTGAVMFLWLLIFKQWKRLRPLYLPSGLALFLAIALPWHVLAGLRNPTWAHRYLYYEHWARYFTTAHGRVQPWHFFIWIALAGFLPWSAFLWPAVREAVRGGWARRGENAVAWFLVTWVGFILVFFSLSDSKLVPYILPIFPALAVLVGRWLAEAIGDRSGATRLRPWLRIFSFACGLLAVALLGVVLSGRVIHDAWQAEALRTPAIVLAGVLLTGGIVAPALTRGRGVRMGVIAICATVGVFVLGLTFAAPNIQKPGTKTLAAIVVAGAKPGDRVVHYHDFFHDFTFYAARVVDVVGTKGELELEEDAAARASGRFYDEKEFRERWAGPDRLWVVARKRDVKELFTDPTFHKYLLGESRDHYLFSNRP